MIVRKIAIVLLSIAAVITLPSCTTTSPVTQASVAPVTQSGDQGSLESIYSRLGDVGGKVFTLNSKRSAVRIYAFRAGRAAKVGHNHVLSAPQFTGFVYLPSSGASGARFDLAFRLDLLEIDNPEYRSALGGAFSSILTPEAIDGMRDHMLGAGSLQADRFPLVRIHSLQISGEAPKFAAKIQVELHGQEHDMWVPLNVDGLPDQLSVTGSFVLRQTDFGVQPYSVLGGLLAVQDEVIIEFKLVGI